MKEKGTHSFSVELACIVGVEKALILKEIVQMQEYKIRNDKNPWVYYSSSALVEKFPYMADRTIRRYLKQLEDEGWIKSELRSEMKYDRTKSYMVNLEKYEETEIGDCIGHKGQSIGQIDQSNGTDGQPITPLSTSLSTSSKEEEYIVEKDFFLQVVQKLNQESGRAYKPGSRKTKSCIQARVNEGFTMEDFERVIEFQVAEWKDDPAMKKYIRPETLFGNKFEGYLQNALAQVGQREKEETGEKSRYREDYEKYLEHVQDHYPTIPKTVKHLSLSQFESFKEESTPGIERLNWNRQYRTLFEAHAEMEKDAVKRSRHACVWDLFLHKIRPLIAESMMI